MKKTQKIGLILALLVFLSSCGSLSVTRMRYNRGLNIDWFGHKDDAGRATVKKEKVKKPTVVVAENEAKTEAENEAIVEEQTVQSIENANPAEIEQVVGNTAAKAAPSQKKMTVQKNKVKSTPAKREHRVVNKVKAAVTTMSHKQQTAQTNEDEEGIMLVLLIILALFIPPLALAIHSGIDGAFWTDLLIWLVGILLYGVLGNLGYILIVIAVVYAILLILGLIGG